MTISKILLLIGMLLAASGTFMIFLGFSTGSGGSYLVTWGTGLMLFGAVILVFIYKLREVFG